MFKKRKQNYRNGGGGSNVVIPMANGNTVITGKVRNGTQIVGTVRRTKHKNYTEETFVLRGKSYIPNHEGNKVSNSIGTIRARSNHKR